MLHSLRLGAWIARHLAAVIRSGSPGVYNVQWYFGLVCALSHSKNMVRDPHGQGSPGPVIVQGYSWLVCALLHSLTGRSYGSSHG